MSTRWWEMKEAEMASTLTSQVASLEADQAWRRMHTVQFSRVYQNQTPTAGTTRLADDKRNFALSQWTSRNVIRACVDTATSKIGKSKPRPLFMTEGGSWKLQQRAQLLTQFLDGQFADMKIYDKGALVFRDGGVAGTGYLKFYVDSERGTVCCERLLPDEIIVDDADAVYGCPTQLHHRKYVSRDVLLALYPKSKKAILAAPSAFINKAHLGISDNLIKVIESFKLPSKYGAGDGKKVISIDSAILDECAWEKDYFPIVAWRWSPKITGWYGMGIAEELWGTQLEINRILQTIQLAQRKIAVPRVWVHEGTTVNTKLDNTIAGVYKYVGQKPTFETAQAMSSEVYQHLERLINGAYEQIGINQMVASGTVPAGLDAAVAMREYADQTSERFQIVLQRWESFYQECAEIVLDLTRDLHKMGSDVKVKTYGEFMKLIKWSDVDLDTDKYVLRMFIGNFLPTTPAGRLAKVQELVQAGWIDKPEGMKLLDMPDLRAYTNRALAGYNLAQKMIDGCIEDGIYTPPEPGMNIVQTYAIAQERFLEAKLNNAPAKNLACLSRFIETVKGMLPAAPTSFTPVPDGAGANPLATPEPAPTSGLLPVQP